MEVLFQRELDIFLVALENREVFGVNTTTGWVRHYDHPWMWTKFGEYHDAMPTDRQLEIIRALLKPYENKVYPDSLPWSKPRKKA